MILKSIDKNNFKSDVLESSIPVLVDFWSPTCGPCKMYNQVLEKLEPTLSNHLKIFTLNVDEEIEIANQEGILIMPTSKIYVNGECLKDLLGVQTPKDIQAALESLSLL